MLPPFEPPTAMLRATTCAAAIVLLAMAPAPARADSRADMQRARRLVREGRAPEAVEVFRRIVATRPSDAALLGELCWAQFLAGRRADARRSCQAALAARPAERVRARIVYNLGRIDPSAPQASATLPPRSLPLDPAVCVAQGCGRVTAPTLGRLCRALGAVIPSSGLDVRCHLGSSPPATAGDDDLRAWSDEAGRGERPGDMEIVVASLGHVPDQPSIELQYLIRWDGLAWSSLGEVGFAAGPSGCSPWTTSAASATTTLVDCSPDPRGVMLCELETRVGFSREMITPGDEEGSRELTSESGETSLLTICEIAHRTRCVQVPLSHQTEPEGHGWQLQGERRGAHLHVAPAHSPGAVPSSLRPLLGSHPLDTLLRADAPLAFEADPRVDALGAAHTRRNELDCAVSQRRDEVRRPP